MLLSCASVVGTSISDVSSFLTPSNSDFCSMMGRGFSSPRLPFGTSLDTGSLRSDATAGEYLPPPDALPPSPSESEPEAELLSEGERDGDFLSCFSSFFLFFFFFLAACLFCFLDFVSPSVSIRSVIGSFLLSSLIPWSPTPAAAASLALALVVLTGLGGGGGSTSDSAPDSELLSFSPFLRLFFFLLLCFLCFLFFLWEGSSSSLAFMSSFSGASPSPEGMSTAHSIMLLC